MELVDSLVMIGTGLVEVLLFSFLIWGGLSLTDKLYPAGGDDDHHYRFKRQIMKVLISAIGLILLLIVLPISDSTRGQLFSLLGIVITAMIALGSTSFVSNAMAGIMLRSVNNFRPGDFVKIGEHAGRVSERGLFHTEIQTEDRDLTTLPNLFLVQQPVTVIRASGTIISAGVSLGYDVPHESAKKHLMQATEKAELTDGFVRVSELLDHAVLYRVYGFLEDSRKLLLARSRLREEILNVLHHADIEITSPNHMFQRKLDDGVRAIPAKVYKSSLNDVDDHSKEDLIFDKALEAEKTESIRARRDALREQLKEVQKSEDEQAAKSAEKLERSIERLDVVLNERAAQIKDLK